MNCTTSLSHITHAATNYSQIVRYCVLDPIHIHHKDGIMSYPHRPYGYDPAHCPVMGLVPIRRSRQVMTTDCIPDADGGNSEPNKDGANRNSPAAAIGRIAFPFGDIGANKFGSADVENMIDYVVATRQGWRASLVMRSFLRWWRRDEGLDDDAQMRKTSDAIVMLLALNQGRDGFVHGYLSDLSGGRDHLDSTQRAFFRSMRVAAIALALSPILLVVSVMLFLQADQVVSTGNGKLFGFSYDLLFFVGSFGAIGALVSMMMRLGKDVDWAEMEPASVFFNFLFRPCLGFCFALIVLLALRAGILPIPLDQLHNISDMDQIGTIPGAGQQISIVLVLAFLSGFSERLSSALVKRVEDRVEAG
ncbi:hypothetical protein TH44_21115 [Thalassospira xiamenensis]|uniref:Uncharacterized protein n=2 Tax=Thalassospira xiamenensis TaxID=220697 RepID=A0A367WVS3_9PROT|nr:hypothetical protein AUP41_20845 [Thalassospira xiamenensis]RCK45564.1 hypothetical protein TH44_21115 [Thalassospira xiamenensis]